MEKEKTRYFIFLSYRGTAYHGWQVQPNSVTVQAILEEALTTLLSEKTALTGAGRTDTGVHARMFCAHFDCSSDSLESRKNFIYKLNRYLPDDISVTGIRRVKSDANARFSALSRTYKYYISLEKDPFGKEFSWQMHGNPDHELMNKVSSYLFEYNDFTSFSRLHSDTKTNNCRIMNAEWIREGSRLVFTIKADRFLRNMVRAIVGTVIKAGYGKISASEFREIIEAKDRGKAGTSAPACGLFLEDIEYPEDIYI